MTFDLIACRVCLSARGRVNFPPGQAGNILRGALGSIFRDLVCAKNCPGRWGANVRECDLRATCEYARLFEPAAIGAGPSGISDWPRPFVIRVGGVDGCAFEPGDRFYFDLHVFDTRESVPDHFIRAFEQWQDLVSVDQRRLQLNLAPRAEAMSRIRVNFLTPTELKSSRKPEPPDFAVLLARVRDRISTLRALYGAGPLQIEFREFGERAQAVRTVRSELKKLEFARRSSRTGQRHGIGGFIGFAEYEGNLAEFLPYLEAAQFIGVGRHCTWGNGHIAILEL